MRFASPLRLLQSAMGCLAAAVAWAAEPAPSAARMAEVLDVTSYYVSVGGDDRATGLSPDQPMATVEAVLARLQQRRGFEWNPPGPAGLRVGAVRSVTGAGSYGTDMLGPVIIWLRGGVYQFVRPLELGPADSSPLTIAAYPGEKPVIEGSRVIAGWQPTEINGRSAWVAAVPAMAGKPWFFTQLFVNGARAARSVLPAKGDFIMEDSLGGLDNRTPNAFRAAAGDIGPIDHPAEVEVSVMHYWINDRLQLASYDPATRLVRTSNQAGLPFLEAHPLHAAGNARYRLENMRAGLLQPGQWYLDARQSRVYYLPKPGQTPANTEIRAPWLTQLLCVTGDPDHDRRVENIRVTGLTFTHTAVDPRRHNGTHNNAENSGPGVVCFRAARNCAVEACEFTEVGEYAVELDRGSSGITIAGNRFTDLGCGAVKTLGSPLTGKPADRTWMNWITDNTILRGGRIYRGAPGIVCSQPVGFVISHNEIADFYYNGLTFGGGPPNTYPSFESRIEYNLVHDIGQGELSDVAALYLHGVSGSVYVYGNVAHDVKARTYGGEILYLDDSCFQVTVENNLLYDASHEVVQLKGRDNVLRNNIFAFGGTAIVRTTEREAGGLIAPALLLHNILITAGAPVFASLPDVPVLTPGWLHSDANQLWSLDGSAPVVGTIRYGGQPPQVATFAQWREQTGNDRRSVLADPGFKDVAQRDFHLTANAAALAIGFQPFDFSQVGPRSQAERRAHRDQPAEIFDPRSIAQ